MGDQERPSKLQKPGADDSENVSDAEEYWEKEV